MASLLGVQLVRATTWDVGEAATGNIQLGVSCRVEVGDFEGIELPHYLHFNTDENTRRSLDALRTMGVRGTDKQIADDLLSASPKLDGFGSKRFQVTVVEEADLKGEMQRRIAWVGGGIPLATRLGAEGRSRIADAISRLAQNGAPSSSSKVPASSPAPAAPKGGY